MNWQEVQVFTNSLGIEAISGVLLHLGVKGWVVEDPQELQAYLNQENKPWDYVCEGLLNQEAGEAKLIFYLPQDEQGRQMLAALVQAIEALQQDPKHGWGAEDDLGSLSIKVNQRDPKEWEENWKQYYKPFAVGCRLVIKPSWEAYTNPMGEDRMVLEIDPNASFGTGQHETTKLCLEAAEQHLHQGSRVLDMGCGTGILSIGAMLLGAGRAVAVDIEAHSAVTAKQNACNNQIDPSLYESYSGNILTDNTLVAKIGTGYDLILANIVADVIIAMADLFWGFLTPTGCLICSGIIDERKAEVEAALQTAGFRLLEVKEAAGWVALVAAKN